MRALTREQFNELRKSGSKFCWATLYERQDYMLHLSSSMKRPIRDITNEPNHHHREIGKK